MLLGLLFRIYVAGRGSPTIVSTAAATIRQVSKHWHCSGRHLLALQRSVVDR